jgi:hypothetical protein
VALFVSDNDIKHDLAGSKHDLLVSLAAGISPLGRWRQLR